MELTVADGLRKLADWVEKHPEVPVDVAEFTQYQEPESKEKAAELVRALTPCRKDYTDSYLIIYKDFGGVILKFIWNRETTCTKRVVGKRVVPERYIEGRAGYVSPEHEEEIVEWDCGSILAPTPEERAEEPAALAAAPILGTGAFDD